MIKFLQIIALFFLLGVAGTAGVVIAKPGETKGMLKAAIRANSGRDTPPAPAPRAAASAPAAKSGSAGSTLASKGPGQKPPASGTAKSGPPAKGTPASGHRPPTKAEIEAQKKLEAVRGKSTEEPTRRALTLGPSPDAINTPPPAPELYPFAVSRRTIPTPDLIRVELNVKNASGIFWQTAYISLRAQDTSKTVVFRIDDWRIDEVVGLDYTFAKSEFDARVRGLRVARVTGIKRESALSEMVGDMRSSVAGDKSRTSTTTEGAPRTANGESYASVKVPGLLGVITSARAPIVGLDVEVTSFKGAMTAQIPLAMPMEHMLPEKIDIGLFADAPSRAEAKVLFEKAIVDARDIEASLKELVMVLSTKTYRDAQEKEVPDIQKRIAARLDAFNKESLDLAVLASTTKDPKVSEAEATVRGVADKVVKMITSIEGQVQKLDPRFTLMVE